MFAASPGACASVTGHLEKTLSQKRGSSYPSAIHSSSALQGTIDETWTSTEGVGGWAHPTGEVFGNGFVTVTSSHRRAPAVIAVDGGREQVIAIAVVTEAAGLA